MTAGIVLKIDSVVQVPNRDVDNAERSHAFWNQLTLLSEMLTLNSSLRSDTLKPDVGLYPGTGFQTRILQMSVNVALQKDPGLRDIVMTQFPEA